MPQMRNGVSGSPKPPTHTGKTAFILVTNTQVQMQLLQP